MVVRVLGTHLDGVVVNVLNRNLGLDTGNPHRLKLEKRHGACRVLAKGLVYPDADLGAGDQLSLDKVFRENLLKNCPGHGIITLTC